MFFQIVFVALLQCLIGLALCFAGFRLFVILLPVFGFFAGFLVTAQAIQEVFGGRFLATASSWVFGFVVGALCALVAYLFYYGAVVVLAATVGYEFGVGIMAGLGVNSGFVHFVVGVVVAAVLTIAVIFLNLPQVFIVVLSALAGAGMILTGTLLALGRVSLTDLNLGLVGAFIRDSWLWSLVYLAIVGFGIAVQLLLPEDYVVEPYRQERMSLHHPLPTMPPRGAEPVM